MKDSQTTDDLTLGDVIKMRSDALDLAKRCEKIIDDLQFRFFSQRQYTGFEHGY